MTKYLIKLLYSRFRFKSLFILTGLQPSERAITFSVYTFPLTTGLKPGENEMTLDAKPPQYSEKLHYAGGRGFRRI